MERIRWQDRITISPTLRHGEPTVRGTRVPVAVVVGSLADGLTSDDIRKAYPQLSEEDIRAALAYAADAVRSDTLVPLP